MSKTYKDQLTYNYRHKDNYPLADGVRKFFNRCNDKLGKFKLHKFKSKRQEPIE